MRGSLWALNSASTTTAALRQPISRVQPAHGLPQLQQLGAWQESFTSITSQRSTSISPSSFQGFSEQAGDVVSMQQHGHKQEQLQQQPQQHHQLLQACTGPQQPQQQPQQQQQQQQQQPVIPEMSCGVLAAAYVKLLLQHTAGLKESHSSSSSSEAAAAAWDAAHWQQLLHHTQQLLPQLQPHQTSLILYTAAKLGRPPSPPLLAGLMQQLALPQLLLLPPRGITNVLWALAVISHSPEAAWMSSYYAAVSQVMGSLNHHQLTSLLWSLGKMGARPPEAWLQALLQALHPALHQLSPTQLSNTLWGLAQLGYRPSKEWCGTWFSASSRALGRCTPDHLACIAGSLGTLRLNPSSGAWLKQYRARVQAQLLSPQMQPWHLATIMCGLAKRRSSQAPHWVSMLLTRQLELLEFRGSLRPADVAATVWALPRLLYPTPGDWAAERGNAAQLRALAAANLPLLPACSVGELVQLAVGFAGLRFYPGAHWLKVHENAVAAKHTQLSAANRMRLRAAVRTMWADDRSG